MDAAEYKHIVLGLIFLKYISRWETIRASAQASDRSEACVPPVRRVEQLGAVVAPLLERRIANSIQARQLSTLRDALLPRLISGKLRLPEARDQLEEALA